MASAGPSAGTWEILVNGIQYMQVACMMLASGSKEMRERIGDWELDSWAVDFQKVFGWVVVFNFDFDLIGDYYPSLAFLKYLRQAKVALPQSAHLLPPRRPACPRRLSTTLFVMAGAAL